jgi:hypothetical protein
MYAMIAIVVQIILSSAATMVIAPHSVAVGATTRTLWTLGIASAALSTVGLVATAWYLSRHLRATSGITIGWLCGLLCCATLALALDDSFDFSVVVYLTLLAPTLLAVLLASLLDRPKSGWQT